MHIDRTGPSTLVFLALGAVKLHLGKRTDSGSMYKDGLCSLSGATLSFGVWLSAHAGHAFWWLDALIAVLVAWALAWHGRRELLTHEGQWRTASFWRSSDPRTTNLAPAVEMDARDHFDPDEIL